MKVDGRERGAVLYFFPAQNADLGMVAVRRSELPLSCACGGYVFPALVFQRTGLVMAGDSRLSMLCPKCGAESVLAEANGPDGKVVCTVGLPCSVTFEDSPIVSMGARFKSEAKP